MNTEPSSILKQTKFESGYYEFPDESDEVRHFNCGLLNTGNGLRLITRRMVKKSLRPFKSEIWDWRLAGMEPHDGIKVQLPYVTHGDSFEDPRAIIHNGEEIISYCNAIQGCYAHQAIFNLKTGKVMRLEFGNNKEDPHLNIGHEKNWVLFSHDGQLHLVYRSMPHMVVSLKDGGDVDKVFLYPQQQSPAQEWKFGDHRGGTPPVRVGDEYFAFFHSSLPEGRTRRYYIGCYAFEAVAPFKITRCTKNPILVGSLADFKTDASPPVVFPCGSHYEDGEWLVVGGMNDVKCFWIKIPHDELLKLL